MFELFFWPTPNGYKPLIMLEELRADYDLTPINIFRGEQHDAEFSLVTPNGRIPVLVDRSPSTAEAQFSVFESGAILEYLSEKVGSFGGTSVQHRSIVRQWLYWQVGGLGPMMGQSAHFVKYALEEIPYARTRYLSEVQRLLGVLDRSLSKREFIADQYSIADMAIYPWVRVADVAGQSSIEQWPNIARWFETISERDAVKRAYALGEAFRRHGQLDDEARSHLFRQRTNS